MAYYQHGPQREPLHHWAVRGDAVTPWLHCASCARKLLGIVRKLRKKRRR